MTRSELTKRVKEYERLIEKWERWLTPDDDELRLDIEDLKKWISAINPRWDAGIRKNDDPEFALVRTRLDASRDIAVDAWGRVC